MFFLFDILEQWDINLFFGFLVKESPTQIMIFFFELIVLIVLYFLINTNYKSYFFYFFLSFIELIRSLFEAKISNLNFAVKHSIFFYCIFILILVRNLFGMNFEVYTITSFINEPFFFSFTFLIGIFFLSIRNFGFKFIAGFTPSNTPVGILPFLLLIEIVSYLTRLISVALRLFINMIAGHALLKIFVTISWVSFYSLHSFLITLLLTWPLVIIFIFLEIVACILQALVLTSLVSLYIDESVNFIYH